MHKWPYDYVPVSSIEVVVMLNAFSDNSLHTLKKYAYQKVKRKLSYDIFEAIGFMDSFLVTSLDAMQIERLVQQFNDMIDNIVPINFDHDSWYSVADEVTIGLLKDKIFNE